MHFLAIIRMEYLTIYCKIATRTLQFSESINVISSAARATAAQRIFHANTEFSLKVPPRMITAESRMKNIFKIIQ